LATDNADRSELSRAAAALGKKGGDANVKAHDPKYFREHSKMMLERKREKSIGQDAKERFDSMKKRKGKEVKA
jgi:hypothetical protein